MEIGYKHTRILFNKHWLYINSNTQKVLSEEDDSGDDGDDDDDDSICSIFMGLVFRTGHWVACEKYGEKYQDIGWSCIEGGRVMHCN
jgi:hypothetical protein